jgi:20S proteasome subunit alpha 7
MLARNETPDPNLGWASCSIYKIHDDVKDKEFELELSWVCAESNGKHQSVPEDLLREANEAGKRTMEAEQFDSDEDMDI